MAEPALHRALIEMLPVRLPHPLAAGEAAQQGNRRVGEEVERQDQRRLPMAVRGHVD